MSQHHTSGRQGQAPRRRNNNRNYSQNRREYSNRKYKKQSHSFKTAAKPTFFQKVLQIITFGGYSPEGMKKKTAAAAQKKTSAPARTNIRIARGPNSDRKPQAPRKPADSPRLYAGNLSYLATESDLEDLFKGIGAVRSVEIIYNPRTHKSKGYAFIEMQFMDDAIRAVEVLHDQPFMGRPLTVSAANERQENAESEKQADFSPSEAPNYGVDPDDPEQQA